MDRTFTVAQARELLPAVQARAEQVVHLRADLADARIALEAGAQPRAGIAEVKALEAHLSEALDWFAAQGVQVKGIAPLLLDFPSELADDAVLLCWLEGEAELAWYHPLATGFMGRRPIPDGG